MLLKASVALSAALLLGRLLGFLREVLLAARLGTSAEAEVAIVAMTLPDYLIGVLFSGGFTAALVPALRQAAGAERAPLFRFVAAVTVGMACLVGAAVALSPGFVFAALAPGLDAAVVARWSWVMVVVGGAIPLAALSGLVGAWLNATERFFGVGLGIALYNAVLCGALLPGTAPGAVVTGLIFGVLAAGLARALFVLWLAKAPIFGPVRRPAAADGRLLRLFGAGVVALGLVFTANIVFRSLAGAAGPGALPEFALALRLFELPMALVLAPVSTVLLPKLADGAAPDPRLMRRGFGALVGLSLLALAVGLTAGEPIARAIYDRGAMSAEGMAGIIENARWMFLALPFAALGLFGAAVLNARRRTGVVMANTALALAAGVALALQGQAWVLPGFLLFHAVAGALHALRAVLIR